MREILLMVLRECWLTCMSEWHGFWLKHHTKKYVRHRQALVKMLKETP